MPFFGPASHTHTHTHGGRLLPLGFKEGGGAIGGAGAVASHTGRCVSRAWAVGGGGGEEEERVGVVGSTHRSLPTPDARCVGAPWTPHPHHRTPQSISPSLRLLTPRPNAKPVSVQAQLDVSSSVETNHHHHHHHYHRICGDSPFGASARAGRARGRHSESVGTMWERRQGVEWGEGRRGARVAHTFPPCALRYFAHTRVPTTRGVPSSHAGARVQLVGGGTWPVGAGTRRARRHGVAGGGAGIGGAGGELPAPRATSALPPPSPPPLPLAAGVGHGGGGAGAGTVDAVRMVGWPTMWRLRTRHNALGATPMRAASASWQRSACTVSWYNATSADQGKDMNQ